MYERGNILRHTAQSLRQQFLLNTIADRSDRNDLMAQKRAISESQQKLLAEALRGMPEDITALVHNPSTRAEGLKSVMEERKRQRELKDWEASPFNKSAPAPTETPTAGPGYDELVALQGHPNARIAAAAKAHLEAYYKPHDPKNSARMLPGGGMGSIPGAVDALGEREIAEAGAKARFTPVTVKTGDVEEIMPASVFAARSGSAPVGGRLPPSGSPSGPPNNVPSGGNLVSGGGTVPGSNFPPFNTATDKPDPTLLRRIADAPGTPPQLKAQIEAKIAQLTGGAVPMPAAPAGPPSALPGATQAQFGVSNPTAIKQTQAINQQKAEEIPKMRVEYDQLRTLPNTLKVIEKYSKDAPESVMGSEAGLALTRIPAMMGSTSAQKSLESAQQLKTAIGQLTQMEVKGSGLGTAQGFTDKDLEFIRGQLPMLNGTHGERMAATAAIRQRLGPKIDMLESKIKEFDPQWKADRSSGLNPTEPGAAAPAPTPGKVSALERTLNAIVPSANASERMPDPHVQEARQGNTLSKALLDRWTDFAEGTGYGVGTNVQGYGQIAGLQNKQDVAARREMAPERNFTGKVGEFVGEALADPTNLIPGVGPLKMAAKGALSGFTKPSATDTEAILQTGVSALTGGAAEKLSSMIPATKMATGRTATRAGFEDVPLTQGQIAGKTDTLAAKGIAPQQVEALTEILMRGTGSTETVATQNALRTQHKVLENEFQRLFPGTQKYRLDTTVANDLATTFKPYAKVLEDPAFIKEAPNLVRFAKQVDASARSGAPTQIRDDLVQAAYQEIGRIPHDRLAGAVREDMKKMIEANLGPKAPDWVKLNEQWGNLKDVERMARDASGLIRPSSIKGREGTAAAKTRDFVRDFGVENPSSRNSIFNLGDVLHTGGAAGVLGTTLGLPYAAGALTVPAAKIAAREGGALQGKLGLSKALDASPGVQQLIELLRAGTRYGPREYIESGRQ